MSRGAFRAAINAGLPLAVPAPGLRDAVQSGDELEVDFIAGRIKNVSRGVDLQAEPLPAVLREIIGAGGGIAHMQQRLGIGAGAR